MTQLRMHNSVWQTPYAQLRMPNFVCPTQYGRLRMADFVWSKLRMTQLRMVCHTESAIRSWVSLPYGVRMADSVWQILYGPNSVCPTPYAQLSMADSV